MTTQEFSIEFDILYNNLASNAAPPLNEYEKSVFLTKAQSDIVLELYSGRNNLGLAFESSEEVRAYLHPLISIHTSSLSLNYDKEYIVDTMPASDQKVLAVIREHIWNDDQEQITLPVIPVTHDEYLNLMQNPFRGVYSNRRAIRIDDYEGGRCIFTSRELDTNFDTYQMIFLKRSSPIILGNIGDSTLTIDDINVSEPMECELPPQLHRMILERAVLYAKQAYVGGQAQRAQQE